MPFNPEKLVLAVLNSFLTGLLRKMFSSVVYDWGKWHHTSPTVIRPFYGVCTIRREDIFVASLYQYAAKGPALTVGNAPPPFHDHLE